MARRLTTEEFVEKARAVHGLRYVYGRTVYVRARDKITITCPEHGDFEQTPNSHLLGNGCGKCGGTSKLTIEEFIAKSREIHGNTYSYGRTVYVNSKKKLIITCPEHGDFEQRPGSHLQGKGCPKCSNNVRLITKEFIEKARAVHGTKYGYERAVYVRNSDKVTITCPKHGDFEQTPGNHFFGQGCSKCSRRYQPTTEEFIEKALATHGDKYSYERTIYVSAKDGVVITCPEHGDFEQVAGSHLSGHGCPKCSVTGFNPDKLAYLYILLDTETHSRVKIGISNVPDTRLRDLKRSTPFTLERIDLFETPSTATLQLESFCHSQLESANLTGFDGASEWFKFDGGKLEALREFILSTGGVSVGG